MGGNSSSGGSEDREERKIPTYSDQLKKGVKINFGPEGSGRYKLTDKGLEKSPTALEQSLIGKGLNILKDSKFNKENTVNLRKGFFEGKKRTLDKRIAERTKTAERKMISGDWDQERLDKFIGETTALQSQRSGLDKTSFGVGEQSDDYWLSDAGKAELTAHGYKDYLDSRSAGGTGFDGRKSSDGEGAKSEEQPKVASQMDNTGVKSKLITADKTSPTSVEMNMTEDQRMAKIKRQGRALTLLTDLDEKKKPTLSKKVLLG